MQPGEALDVAAQVAVTLAGFAGIVVVFRPESLHQWSEVDRFRLRLLLMNSAVPLVWSLFGILLLTFDPPPVEIWRWCSVCALVTVIPMIYFNAGAARRLLQSDPELISKLVYYPVALLGTAATILQVVNIVRWNRFAPFFAIIFVYLLAGIAQFLRMLLLPPQART